MGHCGSHSIFKNIHTERIFNGRNCVMNLPFKYKIITISKGDNIANKKDSSKFGLTL